VNVNSTWLLRVAKACDLAAVGGDGEREGMAGSSKRRLQTLGPGIRMF